MSLNIISEQEAARLKSVIQQAQNILVCCHDSPDGDAIGSVLGWADFLRSQGKNPFLAIPDAYPDFLKWMPGTEKLVRHDKHKERVEEALKNADLIFCFDFNTTSRVLDMQEALDAAKGFRVVFDHHDGLDIKADIIVSFPEMSSTCELVFRVICQLGGYDNMTRNASIPLYTGMMTDTGGFTYNSKRPEVFTIIGMLLQKGRFDKDKIYRNVYNNFSEWCIRMRGYVMSQKLNVIQGSHACYYTLTKEEMKRFHYIKGDAEGLVNEPLKIKGMRLSISLREDTVRENTIWVSLRSVDQFYCNKLAEMFFNGGGHKNAAGGKLFCTMEEAEQVVHRAIIYFAAHDGIV